MCYCFVSKTVGIQSLSYFVHYTISDQRIPIMHYVVQIDYYVYDVACSSQLPPNKNERTSANAENFQTWLGALLFVGYPSLEQVMELPFSLNSQRTTVSEREGLQIFYHQNLVSVKRFISIFQAPCRGGGLQQVKYHQTVVSFQLIVLIQLIYI